MPRISTTNRVSIRYARGASVLLLLCLFVSVSVFFLCARDSLSNTYIVPMRSMECRVVFCVSLCMCLPIQRQPESGMYFLSSFFFVCATRMGRVSCFCVGCRICLWVAMGLGICLTYRVVFFGGSIRFLARTQWSFHQSDFRAGAVNREFVIPTRKSWITIITLYTINETTLLWSYSNRCFLFYFQVCSHMFIWVRATSKWHQAHKIIYLMNGSPKNL